MLLTLVKTDAGARPVHRFSRLSHWEELEEILLVFFFDPNTSINDVHLYSLLGAVNGRGDSVCLDLDESFERELERVTNEIVENLIQLLRVCVKYGRDVLIDFILETDASELGSFDKTKGNLLNDFPEVYSLKVDLDLLVWFEVCSGEVQDVIYEAHKEIAIC